MMDAFEMTNPGNRTLSDYPEYVRAIVDVRRAAFLANAKLGHMDAAKVQAVENACRLTKEKANDGFRNCGFYRAVGVPSLSAVTQHLSRLSGVSEAELCLNQGVIDTAATAAEITVFGHMTKLSTAADGLISCLEEKAVQFSDVIKCGRVGLQDSVPVSVGTEMHSYAQSIREAAEAVNREAQKWTFSHLGGGDLGTGYGIDVGFGSAAAEALSRILERRVLQPHEAYHDLNQSGKFLAAHNALMELALAVWRLANDLEFLSSGPRGGIRELVLPAIAPGSSIMPGKINPTAAELAGGTSDRVMADHDALLSALHRSWGSNGALTGLPIKIMMEDCDLLARTCHVFVSKVIAELTANETQCRTHAENSLALGLILNRVIGREKALSVMELARREKITVKKAALALKVIDEAAANELFNVDELAKTDGNAHLMKKYGSRSKQSMAA